MDVSFYLECFLALISKISHAEGSCLFGYMSISSSQFNKIVKAAAHLEFVSFNCCKLQFDEGLNFETDAGYKVKVIALTGCGQGFDGGILNEVGMKHFVDALAKSGLKESLRQISITW